MTAPNPHRDAIMRLCAAVLRHVCEADGTPASREREETWKELVVAARRGADALVAQIEALTAERDAFAGVR